jgi:hypothetical protein
MNDLFSIVEKIGRIPKWMNGKNGRMKFKKTGPSEP